MNSVPEIQRSNENMSGSEDILKKMYSVDLEQKNVSKIFQNSDIKAMQRKNFVKRRLRDVAIAIVVLFIVFIILN